MKNYQKNSVFPSVPFPCMLEQLKVAELDQTNKWHLTNHIWSLNLNLVFKPTSFNCVASCTSSINNILPCHIHASYCCIAYCVSSLLTWFRRWDRWHRWRTILSSEVPGKQNPLVHSDTIPLSRSCSLLLH